MWEYILNNYFTIYGTIMAIAYPLWLFVIVPIVIKITGESPEWTEIEDFFAVTVFYPAVGAFFLLFWPLTLSVSVIVGLFLGIFYLNKFRIESKEKSND